MENSYVQFNDFPDEILSIIFKNLDNISLLYSLFGVNKRLDKVLSDSTFTKTLSLIEHFSPNCISLLNNRIIDRFCLYILPGIAHKIEWLNLEISSMEGVLLSGNYSNLFGLGIYDITKKDVLQYFSGKILMH